MPTTSHVHTDLRPRSKVTFGVFVWEGPPPFPVRVLIGTISHDDLALPSSRPQGSNCSTYALMVNG